MQAARPPVQSTRDKWYQEWGESIEGEKTNQGRKKRGTTGGTKWTQVQEEKAKTEGEEDLLWLQEILFWP